MSCGQPHETPCSEVLADVYLYLDDEQDAGPRDGKREDEVGAHRMPSDERLNGRHHVLLPQAGVR